MRRYDKRIRPFVDENRPVIVEMTIVMAILTELVAMKKHPALNFLSLQRENQQVAAVVFSQTQRWRDPKLTWNPLLFNNRTEVVVPQSLLWVPKLFVYNSMETKEMLNEDKFDAKVSHDGTIKLNIPQFVTCLCRLNIDPFPFDTQFCAIAQASPLLNTNEMDINATKPPSDSYFAGNAEWEVMNVSVRHMKFLEDGEYRSEVHYILHLRRRPIYYITVIVAPTFLISALSILGIFSPGTNDGPRNEKVSLGLGSLLAMTVLLDIVAGAMPKSNSIPLLALHQLILPSGYYIVAVILLCAVAVGISMASLAINRQLIHKGKLPTRLTYRMLLVSPFKDSKKRRHTCTTKILDCVAECEQPKSLQFPDLELIYSRLLEIAESQRSFRRKLEMQLLRKSVELEWNKVFSRFDYFFLFIFELLNLIILLMFLRNGFLPVPQLPNDFAV
ncbi:unnamed protein product [Toxocara canis]|uniref:Neur_chan_LBD domain-containing protein n=1 Tax=Toxocara canis TaxID=6265 RepID=A0A183UMS8_TOXCA|nr:unnamed protein product [Toxocara canis]